jgi:hypothetical protein
MNKFKHAALALAAASLMTVQAHATEVQAQSPQAVPVATFSQADIHTMFDQAEKPMQLAALSGQEMKDTEGAWLQFGIGGLLGGAGYGWGVYRGSYSWNTSSFLGNVGTGALIGGTFGAAGAIASGGARFIPSLTNAGANIWRFNSAATNFGVNNIWRR